MQEYVDEEKAISLQLDFTDINGADAAPSKIKFKLVDVNTATIIVDTTEQATTSSTEYVSLVSAKQAIVDNTLSYENKRFTVEWYSGTTKLGSKQFIFPVKNNVDVPLS